MGTPMIMQRHLTYNYFTRAEPKRKIMTENSGIGGNAEPIASSGTTDFLKDAKLFIEEQKKALLKVISNVQESYGNFTSKLCDTCRTAQPDSPGSGEFLAEVNRFTEEQRQALQNGGSAAQDSCGRLRSSLCNSCRTAQPDSPASGDFFQEVNRFAEEQRQALLSGGSAARDSFGKLQSSILNIFNGTSTPAQPVVLTEEQIQEALVAEEKKRANLAAVYEDIMRSVTEEKEEEQSRKNVATERQEKENEYNKKMTGLPGVDEATNMVEIVKDGTAAAINQASASIASVSNIAAPTALPVEPVAGGSAINIPVISTQAPVATPTNFPTVTSIVEGSVPNVKAAVAAVSDIAASVIPTSLPAQPSSLPIAPAVVETNPIAAPIVSSG